MSQTSSSGRGGRGWGRGGKGGNWRGRGWGAGRGRGNYYNHYGNNQRGRGNHGNFSQNSALMGDPVPQRQPIQTRLEIVSPYKGWKFYFPDEGYSEQSAIVKCVELFEKYFISWSNLYNWSDIEVKSFFTVNFKDLSTDQSILGAMPDLANELKNSPDQILSCVGLAMHQVITQHHKKEAADAAREAGEDPEMTLEYTVPMIHARIVNSSPPIPLKNLKANCYGKFVCVKGTVVRVGNIKPLCTTMGFECVSCGTMQCVALPDGKYIMPTKCPSPQCRSRVFIPKRSSSFTETIDWQTIRVQEIIGDGQKESGRIPRTIDCELTYDLVDSCVPGDIITVSGIVKVNSIDEGRGRNKDKCMFLLYLHANSVNNLKGNKSGGEGSSGLAMDFSMKELYAIEEIQSEPNLFRLLVGSLCPTIYGHELVKAGLILGLFGGSQKYANDKNRIPVRGDPHILVVGDPGLGKSQMLIAAANIAPRSVYVCGNTTTTSGLTVTLSKDGGSGDFALEAGALVLADQGACCIDEFDKMTSQHQALLEAMEQQSISIAKAGIVCRKRCCHIGYKATLFDKQQGIFYMHFTTDGTAHTMAFDEPVVEHFGTENSPNCSLPARTSILAAANPVGGHYNKAKTVAENLKMGCALLSRFDLVFILLDKPDEEMDSMLSDHVMALHGGCSRVLSGATAKRGQDDLDESRLQWESDRPLSERLKQLRGATFDPIPHQLLRKYIGYARKYVHPKIGPDAAKLLQNFYLDLRKRHQTQDSTPITTRQLESLIRLSEARARLELRELVTCQDAEDVIEIMKYSMVDTYSDQFGWIDFKRSQHGSGMSGRSQPKRFVAALQKVSEQTYNSIFTLNQMRQISKDIGLQVQDFEGFISSLNNQGYLLKKGSKVYQLQTFGY